MAVYELTVEDDSQRNEKCSVGWLLDETIGRPGLPGLCTLGRM